MSLPFEIVLHRSIPNAFLLYCKVSLLVVKFGRFLTYSIILNFTTLLYFTLEAWRSV